MIITSIINLCSNSGKSGSRLRRLEAHSNFTQVHQNFPKLKIFFGHFFNFLFWCILVYIHSNFTQVHQRFSLDLFLTCFLFWCILVYIHSNLTQVHQNFQKLKIFFGCIFLHFFILLCFGTYVMYSLQLFIHSAVYSKLFSELYFIALSNIVLLSGGNSEWQAEVQVDWEGEDKTERKNVKITE